MLSINPAYVCKLKRQIEHFRRKNWIKSCNSTLPWSHRGFRPFRLCATSSPYIAIRVHTKQWSTWVSFVSKLLWINPQTIRSTIPHPAVSTSSRSWAVMCDYSIWQPFQWFPSILRCDLWSVAISAIRARSTCTNDIVNEIRAQHLTFVPNVNREKTKIFYQNKSRPNHGDDTINCKSLQLRVTYAMPAISMYDNGIGNKSSMPMMVDHLPVTISTASTNEMFTIDIHTNPIVKRNIIDGISDCTRPNDVPIGGAINLNVESHFSFVVTRTHTQGFNWIDRNFNSQFNHWQALLRNEKSPTNRLRQRAMWAFRMTWLRSELNCVAIDSYG